MVLDVLAAVVVLWGILRGGLRGFLFQLGQIGLLAVAYVGARGLADFVEPWIARVIDTSPLVRTTLAFFLVFFVVFALGSLVLRAFTKDLHEASKTLSSGDRILGAVVGGVKGVVVVYLAVVLLIMANQLTGHVPVPYASSVTGRWVMKHNLFETEAFPRARALVKLAWLVQGSGTGELLRNEHLQAILEHPKAAVLRSPEVVDAAIKGDWIELMGNDALWDLLDEPEIQDHLNAIEWAEGVPATSAGPEPAPPPPPTAPPPAAAPPSPPAPSPPSSSRRPPGEPGAP